MPKQQMPDEQMQRRRVLLTLSYDGSNYAGWQRQPEAKGLSVQHLLEQALRQATGHGIAVHGAGRTDAGVHALAQTCHFDFSLPTPIEKLPLILNRILPADIRVIAAGQVDEDFHARISAKGKHYRYLLEQQPQANAFCGRFSWQIEQELDAAAMQQAGDFLLGEHDFRNFTLSKVSAKNFVRSIHRLQIEQPKMAEAEMLLPWQQLQQPLIIDVEGNGFLYKMVRIIVARLVAVGRGELPPEAMRDYLAGCEPRRVPPAPARGLMLFEVKY